MALIDNLISLFGKSRAGARAQQAASNPGETPPREDPAPPPPPLFSSNRIFYQSGYRNQDPGWYFMARGGACRGPFRSRGLAEAHLKSFIARCVETQDSGGRVATNRRGGGVT